MELKTAIKFIIAVLMEGFVLIPGNAIIYRILSSNVYKMMKGMHYIYVLIFLFKKDAIILHLILLNLKHEQ